MSPANHRGVGEMASCRSLSKLPEGKPSSLQLQQNLRVFGFLPTAIRFLKYRVGLIAICSPLGYSCHACYWSELKLRRQHMLYWALVFLIVAIIAAIFGFGGVAVAAAGIAKLLFFIFLVVFIITLITGLTRRGGTRI
jgi:uncharacterized membrane protein YtjA (UPF0391 family)